MDRLVYSQGAITLPPQSSRPKLTFVSEFLSFPAAAELVCRRFVADDKADKPRQAPFVGPHRLELARGKRMLT
jgi:hypothetical protein